MKTNENAVYVHISKGFTLIELLVVVLIIGILAAVAVPQYKLAVVKSRVGTILPILKSIADAEEAYFLSNGEYTIDANKLDVTIPTNCSLTTGGSENTWKCGKHFIVDFSSTSNKLIANYCPDITDFIDCQNKRDFQIVFMLQRDPDNPGKHYCKDYNNSSLGKQICNSLML